DKARNGARQAGKAHHGEGGQAGKGGPVGPPGKAKEAKPGARAIAGDPHAAREAARYENPIASRELILQTLADSDGPMDPAALAAELGLEESGRVNALNARLRAVLRDGQLHQHQRRGLVPARRVELTSGRVNANADGF